MNHRFQSAFAFTGTVAIATLAAALMASNARAEGPIEQTPAFVSSRSAAEVRAEVMRDRHLITSAGGEWSSQGNVPQAMASGTTRAELREAYIAARDEVRAMNSETGGSGYFAARTPRSTGTVVARQAAQ